MRTKARIQGAVVAAVLLLSATSSSAITAVRVAGVVTDDPENALWNKVPAEIVPLMGQMMTLPMNPSPATKQVRVQSCYDAEHIAFRLQWKDPTQDTLPNLKKTSDGAAVQIPERSEPPPSFTMGDAQTAVHILNWRASYQEDLVRGTRHTRDVYPNAWSDAYADKAGRLGDQAEFDERRPHARVPFVPAQVAGNPVAEPRTSAVEEILAFGFKNFNTVALQGASGRGVWKNGTWTLVLARHRIATAPHVASLSPGDSTLVGFAVWDGGRGEVGPRKAVSIWQPMTLAR